MLVFALSSHEATKNLINACYNALEYKLRENLLVTSEQDGIFHMLYVNPNLVLEYHFHYL